MENVFELEKGNSTDKKVAKQLKKIYLCPSDTQDHMIHINCIIWKVMRNGCSDCPFRTYDL
jgi:hypothetical protein